jgi:hypothetical protein
VIKETIQGMNKNLKYSVSEYALLINGADQFKQFEIKFEMQNGQPVLFLREIKLKKTGSQRLLNLWGLKASKAAIYNYVRKDFPTVS